MSIIIGLCGDAGSGKDTVAEVIKTLTDNAIVYSFARPVYELAAAILGTTADYLSNRKGKEIVQMFQVSQETLEIANDVFCKYNLDSYDDFPSVWFKFVELLQPFAQPYSTPYTDVGLLYTLHISPRKMLELVGTELGRNMLDTEVWTDTVLRSIHSSKPHFAVITDVRFGNEVELVKQLDGQIVKVRAANNPYKIESSHESNKGIPDTDCDYFLDNTMDGLSVLTNKVEGMLLELLGSPSK